jgi:hypothetical protein
MLYQLSYWPSFIGVDYIHPYIHLFRLTMRCMLSTTRAILAEFHTIGIVSTILFGSVISLLAVIALECNNRANILFL